MRNGRRTCAAPLMAVAIAAAACAGAGATEVLPVDSIAATARRAGLRVLEGDHLVLVTDRPPRDGDGVADLPRLFDEAFAAWCRHYGIDPRSLAEWRACGCLVVDRERFRNAGLLPDGVPDFANGFCDRGRFWMQDQSNPAYRRHLLLHEGVHAFTLTVRSLATPAWYNEGIAEYLATHRLAGGAEPRFVSAPMPDSAADVEQLGRIEALRELRAAGEAPALADILAEPPGRHHAIASYAASWAAVALFARHPAYAEAFAAVERGPLDAAFNDRVARMPGFDGDRAARDFDALTDDVDYGYDFARSAIDWSPGRPLRERERIRVAADRGWQNSGVALVRGRGYDLRAEGRCTLGAAADTPIESEPDGISLDWYRGRPLGRLLAAQWVDAPADGGRPRFIVLGAGPLAALAAAVDGPLYLKANDAPGSLADNDGAFTVEIAARE